MIPAIRDMASVPGLPTGISIVCGVLVCVALREGKRRVAAYRQRLADPVKAQSATRSQQGGKKRQTTQERKQNRQKGRASIAQENHPQQQPKASTKPQNKDSVEMQKGRRPAQPSARQSQQERAAQEAVAHGEPQPEIEQPSQASPSVQAFPESEESGVPNVMNGSAPAKDDTASIGTVSPRQDGVDLGSEVSGKTCKTASAPDEDADALLRAQSETTVPDDSTTSIGESCHDLSGDSASEGEPPAQASWMAWEDVVEIFGADKFKMSPQDPEQPDPSAVQCQYIPVLVKLDDSAEDLDPAQYVKVHPTMPVFAAKDMFQSKEE